MVGKAEPAVLFGGGAPLGGSFLQGLVVAILLVFGIQEQQDDAGARVLRQGGEAAQVATVGQAVGPHAHQ